MMTIGGLKEKFRCKEKKMKKAIVTTTINPPTKASLAYAAKRDWDFIVVGDTKTPTLTTKRSMDICCHPKARVDR